MFHRPSILIRTAALLGTVGGVALVQRPAAAQGLSAPDLSVYLSDFWIDPNHQATWHDVADGCLPVEGDFYKVLHFKFVVQNPGNANFFVGAPPGPHFVWSSGHGHYHVKDFTSILLMNATTRAFAAWGQKHVAMQDTLSFTTPHGPLTFTNPFDNQGISWGWEDVYESGIPCQFVDISTNVPNGIYVLTARGNAGQAISEADPFDNAQATRLEISGNDVWALPPETSAPVDIELPNIGSLPVLGSATSWDMNRYDVFYHWSGQVRHLYHDANSGGWGDGNPLPSNGSQMVGEPTATSWGPYRLDAFARTTTQKLAHWWWNGGWGYEEWNLNLAGPPAAVAPSKDVIVVAYVNAASNQMAIMRWADGFWSTQNLGGSFQAAAPALAASGARTVQVMARRLAAPNDVLHAYYTVNGEFSEWVSTGDASMITGPVSAASAGVNQAEMVARGTDNKMYWNFYGNSSWSGWLETSGTNLASSPIILSSSSYSVDIMYYETSGGSSSWLRHWSRTNAGTWTSDPLVSIPPVNAAIRPFAASFANRQWGLFYTRPDGGLRFVQQW